MKIIFDKKEYETEELSNEGKVYGNKLHEIVVKKQQLNIQYTDLEVLQKHYSELLRKELPKKEKKKTKTGA